MDWCKCNCGRESTYWCDVLIAPNSYVNFDVPSHSIVIGNKASVISKQNATEDYINRLIND